MPNASRLLKLLFFVHCGLCPFTLFAADSLDKVVLQLRWTHQFQFAGYYAALEQGYYQEAGLDVEIRPRGESPNAIEEVLAGNAQYGATNSSLLLKRLQGEPLVALAAIMQHSPLVWVARLDEGINHIQDLVSRRVKMASAGIEVELVAALNQEGVGLDDLEVVDGFASYDDYFAPELDAVAAYITNQPYYLQEREVGYVIIRPSTYGIDFYGDCLFTSEQEMQDHPERVKAFRAASLRGWEYAMRNPDEIITLIIDKYQSDKSRAHLQFEAQRMAQLLMPDVIEVGHMNPGRWQHMADIFVGYGLVDDSARLKGFVYDPNPPVDEGYYRRLLFGSAAAVLLSALIALALYRFNLRLRKEIGLRTEAEQKKERLIEELSAALNDVETLSGLLPICSYCKKIRDEEGTWQRIDSYIESRSSAVFSHGMCEECFQEHQPDIYQRMKEQNGQPD